MSLQIAKQISARMKAKSLSLTVLEQEAGLKQNIVQNILRGKSKKPSAEILQAVSDVLGCTVRDLLNRQETFQENETLESDKKVLKSAYEHPQLLLETLKWLNDHLARQGTALTVKQVLTCLEEIYIHTLQTDPIELDQAFAEWFVNLVLDSDGTNV